MVYLISCLYKVLWNSYVLRGQLILVTFSQDALFYKILLQNIYFFAASLVFTVMFSISLLVSNPINIGVFRP